MGVETDECTHGRVVRSCVVLILYWLLTLAGSTAIIMIHVMLLLGWWTMAGWSLRDWGGCVWFWRFHWLGGFVTSCWLWGSWCR